jgi:hypothetical protein
MLDASAPLSDAPPPQQRAQVETVRPRGVELDLSA